MTGTENRDPGAGGWPAVTVIVLNYNGLEHLEPCFDSLASLDYPRDRLELMLVDNASRDGSVDFVRSRYPEVTIVQSDKNLGFASGNNLGARRARGDALVILNNDTRVEASFVTELVKAQRGRAGVVAAAAKMLTWDGTGLDFGGGITHFSGHARQIGLNMPNEGARADGERLLFACGAAMLIDRRAFLDCGGFDDDYFMYFEDVDLGWRLSILGHDIVFAAKAIVYHRHHGTARRLADYRKRVLYHRNAICSAIKNYGEENLSKILPALLLGRIASLVEGAAANKRIDLADFDVLCPAPPVAAAVSLDKSDLSPLVGAREVVRMLPAVLEKRRAIQRARRRSDVEIAPLFLRPFGRWTGVDPFTQHALVDAFALQPIFASAPRRVLVLADADARARAISGALRGRGHDARLSMPQAGDAAAVPSDGAWEPKTIESVIRAIDPDAVVVCGSHLARLLRRDAIGVPLVLDAGEGDRPEAAALGNADFITAPGSLQLERLGGALRQAGWTDGEIQERTAVVASDGSDAAAAAIDALVRHPRIRPRPAKAASKSPLPAGRKLRHYLRAARQALREGGVMRLLARSVGFVKDRVRGGK